MSDAIAIIGDRFMLPSVLLTASPLLAAATV